MDKFIKVGNGIFVSLAKRIGYVPMTIPFGASYSIKQPAAEVVAQMAAMNLAARGVEQNLQGEPGTLLGGATNPNPQDSDYIYPLFRALDAGLIEDYWIDFSQAGVVKASMALLEGQTIFTNHGRPMGFFGRRMLDVHDWVGSVNQVFWDEKGEQSGGVAGINTELKVDWTIDPKLARGLLMKPPAVHAVSCTPYFSWDASHKELLEQGSFWQNLGLEVEGGDPTPAVPDGKIVRLIVTEVADYREISFVVKGANVNSNRPIEPEETDEELSAMRARLNQVFEEANARGITLSGATAGELQFQRKDPGEGARVPSETLALQSNEEENGDNMKIKLTAAQRKRFGMENQQGDEFEVEPSVFLETIASLETRAVTAEASAALMQPFIDAERAEVVRLATLVEGITGADQAVTLLPVFADAIKNATPAQLADWKTTYQQRVDARFAPKCQKCGSTEVSRRSSQESGAQNQEVPAQRIPRSGL